MSWGSTGLTIDPQILSRIVPRSSIGRALTLSDGASRPYPTGSGGYALRLIRPLDCELCAVWFPLTGFVIFVVCVAACPLLAELVAGVSTEREPYRLDVLAAAYAEQGRFSDAVEAARRARDLAESRNDAESRRAISERLKLYEQGKAYREAQ